MLSLSVIKDLLRQGKYAWPGGYPMYFYTTDGGVLSFDAVRGEWRNIVHSHLTNTNDGWQIAGYDVNWENPNLYCDHTGEEIESAYL